MATEDGAATTPYAGHIGTLEPGRARRSRAALLASDRPPVPRSPDRGGRCVVQRAKTAGVAMVMVAGEVVVP